MRPAINAGGQTAGSAVGLAAHLAEVHGAVFPADVLLALVVRRLRLRRDSLACRGRAGHRRQVSFYFHSTAFPHRDGAATGSVTRSENCDPTVGPVVTGLTE